MYILEDIKNCIEFLNKNPNTTIDDWLEYNSNNHYDSAIEHINFNINNSDIILYKSHNVNELTRFITKKVGNNEYYDFIAGDCWGIFYTLLIYDDNLFNLDNYKTEKTGLKILENDSIIILYDFDVEENCLYDLGNLKDSLTRNRLWFWNSNYIIIIKTKENDLVFNNINEKGI